MSDTRLVSTAYRQHGAAVFATAAQFVGPEVAIALTQQVFVRLAEVVERLDTWPGSVRAFLVAMARDAALVVTGPVDASHEEKDLLAHLPAETRDAVVMAYFGGMTCREVAAELDQTEAVVRSQIRAGLQQLRALRQQRETGPTGSV